VAKSEAFLHYLFCPKFLDISLSWWVWR